MNASVVLAGLSAALGLVALAAWGVRLVRRRQGVEFEREALWLDRALRTGGLGAAVCGGGLVLLTLGVWWSKTVPMSPHEGTPVTHIITGAQPVAEAPKTVDAPKKVSGDGKPTDTVEVPEIEGERESPGRKRARQLFEMAQAAEKGRSFIEARKSYRRATVIDPTFAPPWLGLASMEALRMDEVGALTALQGYHGLRPEADLMTELRAREDFEPLLAEARFRDKVSTIERGASLDKVLSGVEPPPNNANTGATRLAPIEPIGLQPVRNDNPRKLALELNKRGFQAYKEGRMDDARSLYYQATQLHAGHAIAWYNLACMEALRGDVDGAITALRRFAALSPRVSVVGKVNKDKDFDPIRRSSWFQEQLQTLSRRP